jgi:hypothetical protein
MFSRLRENNSSILPPKKSECSIELEGNMYAWNLPRFRTIERRVSDSTRGMSPQDL